MLAGRLQELYAERDRQEARKQRQIRRQAGRVKNERANRRIADDPLSKYHIAVASY